MTSQGRRFADTYHELEPGDLVLRGTVMLLIVSKTRVPHFKNDYWEMSWLPLATTVWGGQVISHRYHEYEAVNMETEFLAFG